MDKQNSNVNVYLSAKLIFRVWSDVTVRQYFFENNLGLNSTEVEGYTQDMHEP